MTHMLSGNDAMSLEPAQGYIVMVSAYNNLYVGEVSASAESQTSDGCPTAPLISEKAQEGTCGVNWTEPSGDKGNITGYSYWTPDSCLLLSRNLSLRHQNKTRNGQSL
ncbi:uncharacterized protein LOC118409055 [Branchiostoma floridae]|uniref:Uncharacterized protein LOC118409055 n=1 Tax=Branchiostoma floridae TaxID=7739 RepID=A0A9J7HU81_BRAFL|nr:uncharacterized protein LOC118409055 [Branchiostoma floridae]